MKYLLIHDHVELPGWYLYKNTKTGLSEIKTANGLPCASNAPWNEPDIDKAIIISNVHDWKITTFNDEKKLEMGLFLLEL